MPLDNICHAGIFVFIVLVVAMTPDKSIYVTIRSVYVISEIVFQGSKVRKLPTRLTDIHP